MSRGVCRRVGVQRTKSVTRALLQFANDAQSRFDLALEAFPNPPDSLTFLGRQFFEIFFAEGLIAGGGRQ